MADYDSSDPFKLAHCPGPGWQDILGSDDIKPPAFMGENHDRYLGSEAIDAARYYSPEFFRLEIEKMWPNVWQFAAREEDMPEAGDYVTYENAGRSFLLVRQEDGAVRAFHNVCLHRGRKLKTDSGSAEQFVCPFHGFAWNTDGSLRTIPCRWDFGHLTDEKMQLPEATVARWGGYIFVRDNPEGPSIEEYLSPLPEWFQRWKHEDCVTVAWVGKVINANWKITMEAFMESYHAYVTHPQLMPFTGDANAAYHVVGEHVNVNYTPFGVVSPHLDAAALPEQWIIDEFRKYNGRSADNYDPDKDSMNIAVPEGKTARQALGDAMRKTSEAMFGGDYSGVSESELLDALVYNVFPNFAPWGGFMPNIVYRWRPWPDEGKCLMEVRVIARVKEGEASTFGDVDRETLHLTELPCDEAAGMIFVILTPGLPINAIEWMDGMYEDFAALKLENWYYHKARPMEGANWKVAYDGYLEGYHFQAAHTNTVATRTPSNRASYEGFGPHIRLGFPQNSITRLKDLPRGEWGKQENHGYDFVRMLFPNFSFFLAPEMCQFAQLLPGPTPDRNTTILNYVFPSKPETEEGLKALDEMCDFFYNVVLEEDYFLGLKVQNGLESGAMTHQLFGRNEPGNQFFHRWLAYYLDESGQTPKPVMKG